MKKLLFILLSLSLTACGDDGTNEADVNSEEFPELTYSYKFDTCPFEVSFPSKPVVSGDGPNITHALVLQPPLSFRATCTDISQLDTQGLSNIEFAEQYLSGSLETLDENFYKDKTYSNSVPNGLENAVFTYSVRLVEPEDTYKGSGVTFIYDNRILNVAYFSNNMDTHDENALKFYQTATFKTVP